MNGRILRTLLVAGALGLTMLSCSPSPQAVNGQVVAGKGADVPPSIEKGAKIEYGTAAGGNGLDLAKGVVVPSLIQEVRGRWIRVKGRGNGDLDDNAERWLNLDQIVWYRLSK